MDVEYLSDDDLDQNIIDTCNNLEYLKTKPIQFEETNHYPPLNKHSNGQIISMINAIDAINKKLKMQVKAKKHRFKTRSRKTHGQSYLWVYV